VINPQDVYITNATCSSPQNCTHGIPEEHHFEGERLAEWIESSAQATRELMALLERPELPQPALDSFSSAIGPIGDSPDWLTTLNYSTGLMKIFGAEREIISRFTWQSEEYVAVYSPYSTDPANLQLELSRGYRIESVDIHHAETGARLASAASGLKDRELALLAYGRDGDRGLRYLCEVFRLGILQNNAGPLSANSSELTKRVIDSGAVDIFNYLPEFLTLEETIESMDKPRASAEQHIHGKIADFVYNHEGFQDKIASTEVENFKFTWDQSSALGGILSDSVISNELESFRRLSLHAYENQFYKTDLPAISDTWVDPGYSDSGFREAAIILLGRIHGKRGLKLSNSRLDTAETAKAWRNIVATAKGTLDFHPTVTYSRPAPDPRIFGVALAAQF
jgi:hypothetical protein